MNQLEKNRQDKKRFPYNIVLTGFMGTGKSTVAKYLSDRYGMDTAEMDGILAKREGMSIADIFAVHGESYFREKETELLRELQAGENTVISCGGGAVLREENVSEMKKNGRVVLLCASPRTVYERVKNSQNRPILNGNKNVEYIADLMEQRREKYEAAADVVVQTDDKSVAQICEELIKKLTELDESDV